MAKAVAPTLEAEAPVAPTLEAEISLAPTLEAETSVAPTLEAESSLAPTPEATVDRILGAAAGALAVTDHVELSVDSPVAVGEVEHSVVCLVALEEEAVGEACAASAVVWPPVGPSPVQRCPLIPGVTRRSGAAPPVVAAAGAHTAGRPFWQAA
jgi:hypothetical protein